MTPGEALVARIYEYVKTVVPSDQVDSVTKATAQAIAVLMNDPLFTSELRIVNDLRVENQWLKQQVIQLQRILATASPAVAVSKPRRRANPKPRASKAVPGTASRAAKAAFIKGTRQAKR